MQLSYKLRCNAKISATASAALSAATFVDDKDDETNDKFNIDGNLGLGNITSSDEDFKNP